MQPMSTSLEQLLESLIMAPPAFGLAQGEATARDLFGFDATARDLGGERDRNFLLRNGDGVRLLKVGNQAEADSVLDLQCAALRHIGERDPELFVPRLFRTASGADWAVAESEHGEPLRVRLLTFLPGLAFRDAAHEGPLLTDLGQMLGRLDRALRGFFHPAADHLLAWDLKRAATLRELVPGITSDHERALVEAVFERFENRVAPVLAGLRAQIIHNDVSFHNLVVDSERPTAIGGVFDFGDLIHAPLIQDLAVTASEVASVCADPVAASAAIVAGFHGEFPIEDEELALLPELMSTRLAMSIALDEWRSQRNGQSDDRENLRGWRNNVSSALEVFLEYGHDALTRLFREACGMRVTVPVSLAPTEDAQQLRARRQAVLGNADVLSYEQPLHVVRGEGVWLYDADGRKYLDVYNNVPHAGHCHPHVVAAIANQVATLNTNIRYLHPAIVDYSTRLLATLPAELDRCLFVSSGSEANDLAWRMAKAWTGNDGALVMQHAYHGITDAVAHLSPEGMSDPDDVAAHVAVVAPPDDYRGTWKRDDPERGAKFATLADDAIARLAEKGHAPAAFFIDTIMSSNGIMVPPPGYLSGVFSRVHAAGGLCVADEVQAGFGRTGKMWGFETDAVPPDIVTFGKPIGNGHPMGLVVTTRAIAERFWQETEFFSTTAGNPVSCAAALAVLDVIENEGLVEHAERVGAQLRDGLRSLAARHALIGDVRGGGLFVGVELVRDRDTLEPATAECRQVINALRAGGVLTSNTGPMGNVLKLRPPMVFGAEHVDLLLRNLDRVLVEL